MSCYLHDLSTNAHVAVSDQLTAATTANTAGTSADMINDEGECYAIQLATTGTGTSPQVVGYVEESTDGTTWTTVNGVALYNGSTSAATSAGTFSTVAGTTTSNFVQVLSFQRTARYVRANKAVTGTGVSIVTTVIMGQKKQTGGGN